MSRRTVFAALIAVVLLSSTALVLSWTPLQWRAELAAWKLGGRLADMTWGELYGAVQPGRRYLNHERLLSTGSVFASVTNPYTSEADVDAGEEIFEARCLACHVQRDSAGEGAGPDLGRGNFEHGGSDWALFRNISHGIPGTAMLPVAMSDKQTWQVIAFVNSRLREGAGAAPGVATVPAPAVGYERLVNADREPANWLTYSGGYRSLRHSGLRQIDAANVRGLRLKWVYQISTTARLVETSPLVVDGVMYLTEPPNNVVALSAQTGRVLWTYRRNLPDSIPLCCGRVNRGMAVLGNTLFLGTLDAHLVALDATTGAMLWDTQVADYAQGYSITAAPLALNGLIVTGVGGGEYATRGFLAAYDARTGEEAWRFYTVPAPGEPGSETWPASDAWQTGGGATWLTGSFDPQLNLLYWGVGNPTPEFRGDVREGDNQYTDAVIALDADTGQLRWFFQFTPHDEHDWDANQIPMLVDADFEGRPRKLMLWANRNGFYYVLDRENGQFLTARAFGMQTWADGIDAAGRPLVRPGSAPSVEGTLVRPGVGGATNWWSPSYSPLTGLVYVPVAASWSVFFRGEPERLSGEQYRGGYSEDGFDWAALRALDFATGELKWEFRPPGPAPMRSRQGGWLSTAGNVVFGGIGRNFYAVDAASGRLLRKFNLGAEIIAAPVTYESAGAQQVTIAAGRSIFTFALGD
jgi:alcohol dehydrogenase (cytochrome c)